MGYTTDLLVVVWAGYDDGRPLPPQALRRRRLGWLRFLDQVRPWIQPRNFAYRPESRCGQSAWSPDCWRPPDARRNVGRFFWRRMFPRGLLYFTQLNNKQRARTASCIPEPLQLRVLHLRPASPLMKSRRWALFGRILACKRRIADMKASFGIAPLGKRPVVSWLVLLGALALVAACAPKKPVYIPSEWQPPLLVQSPSTPALPPAPKRLPSSNLLRL